MGRGCSCTGAFRPGRRTCLLTPMGRGVPLASRQGVPVSTAACLFEGRFSVGLARGLCRRCADGPGRRCCNPRQLDGGSRPAELPLCPGLRHAPAQQVKEGCTTALRAHGWFMLRQAGWRLGAGSGLWHPRAGVGGFGGFPAGTVVSVTARCRLAPTGITSRRHVNCRHWAGSQCLSSGGVAARLRGHAGRGPASFVPPPAPAAGCSGLPAAGTPCTRPAGWA